MYRRTLQLSILLAITAVVSGQACCWGQTVAGTPGLGSPSSGGPLPGAAAHSPMLPAGGFPAALGPPTAGAAEPSYGPFGIGKPRSFPIWHYLCDQHALQKAKLRASPLGKILADVRKMAGGMTGGVIPPEPHPNVAQLSAPGPQGTSAKIQKDMLEAPLRLEAIQHLGTVDCHWYPEALAQLVTALRTDRSECVRYEAAKILTGCGCCTPPMMHASRVCVAGTEIDGNPGERSFRVRQQAALALENCLACCGDAALRAQPEMYRPEYPDSGLPLSQYSDPGQLDTDHRVAGAEASRAPVEFAATGGEGSESRQTIASISFEQPMPGDAAGDSVFQLTNAFVTATHPTSPGALTVGQSLNQQLTQPKPEKSLQVEAEQARHVLRQFRQALNDHSGNQSNDTQPTDYSSRQPATGTGEPAGSPVAETSANTFSRQEGERTANGNSLLDVWKRSQ